jgi:hypothetical protein
MYTYKYSLSFEKFKNSKRLHKIILDFKRELKSFDLSPGP